MKKSLQKGFTLIELLVVIAIIGILAGIVLTSLGSARNKAKDASVQGSLSSMRAEAELAVTSAGAYPTDLCDNALAKLRAAVKSANGGTDTVCDMDGTSGWAVSSVLPTGGTYCVDGTGFSGAGKTASGGSCQ